MSATDSEVTVNLRLPATMRSELKIAAVVRNTTMQQLIVEVLRDFLDRKELDR